MKKTIFAVLAAGMMMIPVLTAHAEDAVRNTSVKYEDGIMVISITPGSDDKEGFHWESYTGDLGDASFTELLTQTDMEEGFDYVGSFRATEENGEDTIRLVYTDGFVVDQYMDFNVKIEDGKITETIGGTNAFSSSDSDMASMLTGTWQEENGGNTFLELKQAEDGGFDAVVSDGSGKDGTASYFTFTAKYDVMKMSLLYQNGTTHEAAITDGTEETESMPGEEIEGDGTGMLAFDLASEDEQSAVLMWKNNNVEGDNVIRFVRVAM